MWEGRFEDHLLKLSAHIIGSHHTSPLLALPSLGSREPPPSVVSDLMQSGVFDARESLYGKMVLSQSLIYSFLRLLFCLFSCPRAAAG
jgi:hypothetical protein